MRYSLKHKRVLIAGGASFIASHLIERLVNDYGISKLVLVDNFNSGKRENISKVVSEGNAELVEGDLRDGGFTRSVIKDVDVVIQFAAVHGGRGFIGYHDSECVDNFLIDRNVADAALKGGAEKFFYASSGCAYPMSLQKDAKHVVKLKEEQIGPPYEPDGVYGMAKAMGEVMLRRVSDDGEKMNVAVGRFFTVYGERALENHAVMALIAKAFVGQDPYEVWGSGDQVRNWTYVGDIVEGVLAVLEGDQPFLTVNIGSNEETKIKDVVELIFAYVGYRPEKVVFDKSKPVGPVARVADISRMKEQFGWEPKYSFKEGLKKTVEWYMATKDREYIKANLERLLVG